MKNIILGKHQKLYVKELNNTKAMLDLVMKIAAYSIMSKNLTIKLIGINLLSYITLKTFTQEI